MYFIHRKYEGERMVTDCYKAAVHAPDFDTLVPAPELSLADAKNNPFRNMTTELFRERQLWSGNKSVEIRYVNGSYVAGTSALSLGVPRQMFMERGVIYEGVQPLILHDL